jgi:cell division protein FtsX
VLIGALAALASYALFHLITVFPLSWISRCIPDQFGDSEFLVVQMIGAVLGAAGIVAISGLLADRSRPPLHAGRAWPR